MDGYTEDRDFARRRRSYIQDRREELTAMMSEVDGLRIYPGAANYLLARLAHGNADALAERMLKLGIAIRACANVPGLDARFFRVAVRSELENQRLCQALGKALADL